MNCMEELLEEKNKELEQLETQLLTCQQAIRRLRSVCRDYEQESGNQRRKRTGLPSDAWK